MALFKRYQPPQPAPTRPPGETGLLKWILREAHPFLIQTQRWLSRCISYMGKVGVDDTDYPGVAEDKLVATTGVTITKTGAAGDRQLTFGANATQITNIVNTTTIQTAATTGATLYPAAIPDTLLRAPCVGLLPHGEGVGFSSIWEAIAGEYTWQFTGTAGPLVPQDGTLQCQDGDRIFGWSSVPFGPSEPEKYGIYEVVDCGFHWVPTPGHPETLMGQSTLPVIRRSTDANTPAGLCHNMAVYIQGRDAVEHNGDFFTLDTADPIVVDTTELDFSFDDERTSLATTAMLTSQQVATASTDTYETGAAVSSTGTNDTLLMASGSWVTLDGTPAASEIPAGKFTVSQYVKVAVADLSTPPRIDWKFRVVHSDDTAEADFLTVSSPPIASTEWVLQTFEGTLAAAVTISPTDRVEARAYAHATGATVVDVRLTWNESLRRTRIVTTLQVQTGTPGGSTEPYYWEPGWFVDNVGDGILLSLPEAAPIEESATPYVGTVTAAEGEKELAVLHTSHNAPYIWPAGRWTLRFHADVSSVASATHVKATAGTSVTDGTGFIALAGPDAFSAEFLVTGETDYADVHSFSALLTETFHDYDKALAIRFTMRTASAGAVTVTLAPTALLKTTLDGRPRISAAPTLAELGGIPESRTIGGVDLSANRSLADLGIATSGRLVARTIYTTGTSATHSYQAGIAAAHIFGLAGGGGGGGATSTGGSGFAGGGASGGHFFVRVTAGLTSSTYTVGGGGGGGSGGGGGASGSAGGDTVIVHDSVTYTAKGGAGGIVQVGGTTGAVALGGAGVAGTNGNPLSPGACGAPGIRLTTSVGCSGVGAPSVLSGGGNCRNTDGNGNVGTGYGSGGSGAVAISSNRDGGAGASGIVVYEEYSA